MSAGVISISVVMEYVLAFILIIDFYLKSASLRFSLYCELSAVRLCL